MNSIKKGQVYPNFRSFWENSTRHNNPVQLQIGNDLFDEQCCGLERRYGRCSCCGSTTAQKQGFVCLSGLRSGKTLLNSVIAAYQLHRLLAIENILDYFKLSPNTKIYIIFSGYDLNAQNSWDYFYDIWKNNSLLTSYEHQIQPRYIKYNNIILLHLK